MRSPTHHGPYRRPRHQEGSSWILKILGSFQVTSPSTLRRRASEPRSVSIEGSRGSLRSCGSRRDPSGSIHRIRLDFFLERHGSHGLGGSTPLAERRNDPTHLRDPFPFKRVQLTTVYIACPPPRKDLLDPEDPWIIFKMTSHAALDRRQMGRAPFC